MRASAHHRCSRPAPAHSAADRALRTKRPGKTERPPVPRDTPEIIMSPQPHRPLAARTEIRLGARAPHPHPAITGTPPDREPLIDPPRRPCPRPRSLCAGPRRGQGRSSSGALHLDRGSGPARTAAAGGRRMDQLTRGPSPDRALRVPAGWAYGPPFPRPAAAGLAAVVGSSRGSVSSHTTIEIATPRGRDAHPTRGPRPSTRGRPSARTTSPVPL